MGSTGLEGGVTSEGFLVIVVDIRARHVLVFDAGDVPADRAGRLLPGEILRCRSLGRRCSSRRDDAVEDPETDDVLAATADAYIGFSSTSPGFIVAPHPPGAVILSHVPAARPPGIPSRLTHALAAVGGPGVAARPGREEDRLALRGAAAVPIAMRPPGFGSHLRSAGPAGADAVARVPAAVGVEAIEVVSCEGAAQASAVGSGEFVAVAAPDRDLLTVEDAVVMVGDVAGRVAEAVFDVGFAAGAGGQLSRGEEVGHGDRVLAVALLVIRQLLRALQRGAGRDPFADPEVGGRGIAEAGVDVGDPRDEVSVDVVDLRGQGLFRGAVTSLVGSRTQAMLKDDG